jgi:hypothetical protein
MTKCRRSGKDRRNSVRIIETEDRRKIQDDIEYLVLHMPGSRDYLETFPIDKELITLYNDSHEKII